MQQKTNILFNVLFVASTGLATLNLTLPDRHPNPSVIIIFRDDIGHGDLSNYGETQYYIPNLDRLAVEGMRFTHFYAVQAVCSASRGALLTCCYPNRVGIKGALGPTSKIGLNPAEITIAEMLRSEGYCTAAIGKRHVDHHLPFLSLQQGFDEYFGLLYSNDMVPFYYDGTRNFPVGQERRSAYPELPLIKGNEEVRKLTALEDQSELTRYTETAVGFIERNPDHPFFLYLAQSTPRVPLAVSSKFAGKSEQGLYGVNLG